MTYACCALPMTRRRPDLMRVAAPSGPSWRGTDRLWLKVAISGCKRATRLPTARWMRCARPTAARGLVPDTLRYRELTDVMLAKATTPSQPPNLMPNTAFSHASFNSIILATNGFCPPPRRRSLRRGMSSKTRSARSSSNRQSPQNARQKTTSSRTNSAHGSI